MRAKRFFTVDDDGLSQDWRTVNPHRTVWLNPPYSGGHNLTGKWWVKMVAEFRAGKFDTGLFLANSKTETRWFQDALNTCPALLIRGRLSFWR